MSFTIQQLTKAKSVPIYDWLASKGFEPVKVTKHEYIYRSPFNEAEKDPSFKVNILKNVFHCWSTSQKGDVITLIRAIDKLGYIEAVNALLDFTGYEQTYEPRKEKVEPKLHIEKNLPLTSQNLRNYFSIRALNLKIVEKYVREIHYTNEHGSFYAAGFPNKVGGFEIRCPMKNGNVFKACLGQKHVSFYRGQEKTKLALFEGFTDFLSFLTYAKSEVLPIDCLILNSVELLTIERIALMSKHYSVVYSYLDNDKAGKAAYTKLFDNLEQNVWVENQSQILYPNHKDFNDFLIWHTNQKQSTNATKVG